MPELAIDIARAGNECMAVPLFTLLTYLVLRLLREDVNLRLAACVGVVLGLGLLAKAYFLTILPALALVLAFKLWRAEGRRLALMWNIVVLAFTMAVI